MAKVAEWDVSVPQDSVDLHAGMVTLKEDPRGDGWIQDEYIVRRVKDTMSCRNPHYIARRVSGGAPRTVCFDRACDVRIQLALS